MKRAIVMGATGAVGTALVERLIEDNIEVLYAEKIQKEMTGFLKAEM